MSVLIELVCTALTVMPRGARSRAHARVYAVIAALVAEYTLP
jgi:hypothetical protein